MNQGWIKLHRKLLDSAMMQKSAYFHLWVTLLLKANHERAEFIFNNEKMILNPGQLITSREQLSLVTKINQYKVERILKYLESAQQIAQQKTSKFRIISILNWEKYQMDKTSAQQSAHQMHNNCTSSAQQVHTNKNDKNKKNDKNYGNGSCDDSFNKQIDRWMDNLNQQGDMK